MKLKINISLSALFILIILTSTVVILSYNYKKAKENSYTMLNKITQEISGSIIEKAKYYLNKTDTHIKVLSNHSKSNNILLDDTSKISIMSEYVRSEKHIASIYQADNFGNFLQVRSDPKLAVRKIEKILDTRVEYWEYKNNDFQTTSIETYRAVFDPRVRDWFTQTTEDTTSITKPYIYASSGKLGITINYPTYDMYGKKVFVTAIDILLEKLKEFFFKQSKIVNSNLILLDNDNNIIMMTEESYPTGNKLLHLNKYTNQSLRSIQSAKKFLSGNEFGKIDNYIFKGVSFIVDAQNKWSLIMVIDENEIIGEIKETLYKTIIISLIIIVAFLLIAIFISRKISMPIKTLAHNIDSLKHLDLNINIKNDSLISEIHTAQTSLISLQNGLKAFKKYIPSDLVKYLIETGQEATIGGSEKELTVMFTDIQGFTAIAENSTPQNITNQLSEYFTIIETIITKHHGTVDKYIGDSVMAFWGAPIELKQPTLKCIDAALEILQETEKLNTQWKQEGKPILKTKIGIHHGKTLVGNIGSNNRMNYTIIGDTVNIASRLESVNNTYNTQILISQEVADIIQESQNNIQFIDEIMLKGKSVPSKIYTINY